MLGSVTSLAQRPWSAAPALRKAMPMLDLLFLALLTRLKRVLDHRYKARYSTPEPSIRSRSSGGPPTTATRHILAFVCLIAATCQLQPLSIAIPAPRALPLPQ